MHYYSASLVVWISCSLIVYYELVSVHSHSFAFPAPELLGTWLADAKTRGPQDDQNVSSPEPWVAPLSLQSEMPNDTTHRRDRAVYIWRGHGTWSRLPLKSRLDSSLATVQQVAGYNRRTRARHSFT